MAPSGRSDNPDTDGVTVTRTGNVRTGVWLLVLAVGIVALMLVFVIGPFIGQQASVAAPREGERLAASGAGKRMKDSLARRPRAADKSERPQLPAGDSQRTSEAADGAEAAPGDETDDAAGGEAAEPSGIELFPPPGTDPIKAGIVVPDDFELPPGFVRHYQTTDNGKQLPAILMFHPDYQPVDDKGEKIALPEDRIVPPEMAPPGLPHQMLDIPDDSVPMVEGPNDRPDAD